MALVGRRGLNLNATTHLLSIAQYYRAIARNFGKMRMDKDFWRG